MREEIFSLACAISGAGETEMPVLELLCAAAESFWESRLPEGMTAEDCGASFVCAAAYSAAANLAAGQGGGISSFSAGDLSIKGLSGGERAQSLRETAEELMIPYTLPGDVCLKGIRG